MLLFVHGLRKRYKWCTYLRSDGVEVLDRSPGDVAQVYDVPLGLVALVYDVPLGLVALVYAVPCQC